MKKWSSADCSNLVRGEVGFCPFFGRKTCFVFLESVIKYYLTFKIKFFIEETTFLGNIFFCRYTFMNFFRKYGHCNIEVEKFNVLTLQIIVLFVININL